MYLRRNCRYKDGKQHRYWSIVESKRCAGGRVVQRQVLYLGEINECQHEAWCKAIEAFDEDARRSTQLALFPADRSVPDHARHCGVQLRLAEMQLHRPRQWGACWLACQLYAQLDLDRFWAARLPDSREGTSWRHVLQTLVCYRLIDPGSEWRLRAGQPRRHHRRRRARTTAFRPRLASRCRPTACWCSRAIARISDARFAG